MSQAKTGIEWTDSTWNPTTGCTEVSAGCDNCYAATMARGKLKEAYSKRLPVVNTEEHRADPFAVRLWPERLTQPERWRDARMIFVNSMSDLFHVDIPTGYIRDVFRVMLDVDRHIYQVLTKRPARMAKWVRDNADLFPAGADGRPPGFVPPHIWMGTSVEDDDNAYRIGHLASVCAATRFLSCEPLIGPVNLPSDFHYHVDWIITGGESGVGARPCNPDWVRAIRDQCTEHGIAFFHKQWGGRTPKAGGRELDGRTWDQWPMETPA